MTRLSGFVKATLAGGLLFLVPIVVLLVILGKAFAIAHRIVDPLTEHIPFESVLGLRAPVFLAILLLVLVCFLAGLLARTRAAKAALAWLEDNLLSHLPGYEFLKGFGADLLGVQSAHAPQFVLVRLDDAMQLGFLIERLPSGHHVVFVPDVPNPRSGSILLMTADRVTPTNIPAAKAMQCFKRLGAGSSSLLAGLLGEAR